MEAFLWLLTTLFLCCFSPCILNCVHELNFHLRKTGRRENEEKGKIRELCSSNLHFSLAKKTQEMETQKAWLSS
jgi:hypothetical protein